MRSNSTSSLTSLPSPSLVANVDVVSRNIARMQTNFANRNVALRPHAKTHKSTYFASLQLQAGSAGITVATLGEAEVFADAGISDIFIALPIIANPSIASRIEQLAINTNLSVGIDSIEGARLLSTHLNKPNRPSVMIEIDSGQHRTGVDPQQAGYLADTCSTLGLTVEGVFTHGGHGYNSATASSQAAKDEMRCLETAIHHMHSQGIHPFRISAGSTPTASALDGTVNEVRPGTYIFNDRQQLATASCSIEDIGAYVLTRVISNARRGQFVIDAGSKALTAEVSVLVDGYGVTRELKGAVIDRISEHHGMVAWKGDPPPVGTLLTIIPNHICTVVNLFDEYFLVRDSGIVVGNAPIEARGRF